MSCCCAVSACAEKKVKRKENHVNLVFNQHLKTNWTNERLASTNLTWFKVNSLKKSQISSTEREKKEMTVTTRKQVSESRK